MVWAEAALVGGLLLVVATFAVGVEHRSSTEVDGQTQDCGSAISPSWLVSGTGDVTSGIPAPSADGRRTAEACRAVVRQSRIVVLTAMGVGGLLAIAGGTGTRRPQPPAPSGRPPTLTVGMPPPVRAMTASDRSPEGFDSR